jgi:hypothetical protein
MTTLKWTCLKDNPEIKTKIELIRKELSEVNENDSERHLADTGCTLRRLADELKDISEEVFNLHKKQKVV